MDHRNDDRPAAADTEDLTAYLIPDTPASLTKHEDPAPIPSTAELLAAWVREQERLAAEADQPAEATASTPENTAEKAADGPAEASEDGPAPIAPLIPRWAWKTAAYAALGGAVIAFVAFVVWGIGWLLAQAAAFIAAAAPILGAAALAAVVLVALLRGKRDGGTVTVTQTQRITVRR
ncbi:hypothetical protein [Streptomyces cavernicola]|uniref:Phage holin family protein n=1 Tax=Streptomyces cavernicola TaxID=3043613 RepID=A0ABT6SJF0_9ACTN|nr:hypothetical protein [Streptomyces sp. B-S-A6]MDI3408318.1 hypothetical protein [Streptomyces sp. B-S-A6]